MPPKYRVAIIGRTGHGDYGHDLDLVWKRLPDEVEIVGVADDDPAGLAKAAERLELTSTFADYLKMLDETKPDIVSICQRWTDRHHAMVLEALQRKMHVLIEKPLCRTLAEADEIVAASERSGAHVAVAHQTRYSPKLAIVRQLIQEGKLGRVLEYRGRGKEDQRGGGEDLWVLGSHIMDLIRTLGGDPQWCFASVTEAGRPIRQSDVMAGPEGLGLLAGNGVQAMFGMRDGATGFFASQAKANGDPSRLALQIFGTRGVLEIETGYLPSVKFLGDSSWSPARSKKNWVNVSSAGIGVPEPLENKGMPMGNELIVRDLLAAIAEKRPPVMNAKEARAAMEMIVACFESARTGGRVEMPLTARDNPLSRLEA